MIKENLVETQRECYMKKIYELWLNDPSVVKETIRNAKFLTNELKDKSIDDQGENGECSVCLMTITEPQECPKCKALICKDCKKKWYEKNKICPVSRCDVEFGDITTKKKILDEMQVIC